MSAEAKAAMRKVIYRTNQRAAITKEWEAAIRRAVKYHSMRAVARSAGVSAATVLRIAGRK